MYKRIVIMYLIIMCACNRSHTHAYGAATVEEEKHTSLSDRVGGGWEKKTLCSGYG